VIINFFWKIFHNPIVLVVLTTANIGEFSNFCRYFTRSQTGKGTGYRPTLKSLVSSNSLMAIVSEHVDDKMLNFMHNIFNLRDTEIVVIYIILFLQKRDDGHKRVWRYQGFQSGPVPGTAIYDSKVKLFLKQGISRQLGRDWMQLFDLNARIQQLTWSLIFSEKYSTIQSYLWLYVFTPISFHSCAKLGPERSWHHFKIKNDPITNYFQTQTSVIFSNTSMIIYVNMNIWLHNILCNFFYHSYLSHVRFFFKIPRNFLSLISSYPLLKMLFSTLSFLWTTAVGPHQNM
jgi:hypothetical protein